MSLAVSVPLPSSTCDHSKRVTSEGDFHAKLVCDMKILRKNTLAVTRGARYPRYRGTKITRWSTRMSQNNASSRKVTLFGVTGNPAWSFAVPNQSVYYICSPGTNCTRY
ncbi:unnamed protein product [Sphacelaria rigidula]